MANLGPGDLQDSPRNNTLKAGPPFFGIVMNWWLQGILTMQYLMYFNHGPRRDHKFLRGIVHFIFLLDLAQSIMAMVDGFEWFVYDFGDHENLLRFQLSSIDSPVLDGVIAFIVQLVYCWRIWVLSKWRVLPGIIAFLALVGCANSFVIGINDAIIKSVTRLQPNLYVTIMLWYGSSAATDILITLSMVYLLMKFRSQRTSRGVFIVLKRLAIITLETNILTTAVALATLILVLIRPIGPPFSTIYLTGGYVLGKLYSNCFMVLLNQRIYYTDSATSHAHTEVMGTFTASSSYRTLHPPTAQSKLGEEDTTTSQVSTIKFADPPSERNVEVQVERDVELG